jgi:hypothetical protein
MIPDAFPLLLREPNHSTFISATAVGNFEIGSSKHYGQGGEAEGIFSVFIIFAPYALVSRRLSFLWDNCWKKQNCAFRKDRSVNASRAATNVVLGAG